MGDHADDALDAALEEMMRGDDEGFSTFSHPYPYSPVRWSEIKRIPKVHGPGNCPRCGGETHYVDGKNGPFYGCNRFPDCKGTRSADSKDKGEANMATKFYALITGKGCGCDYTIACNVKFQELEAKTWEEAKREAYEIADDDRIESVKIVFVTAEEDVDMDNIEAMRESEAAYREREKRRAEYLKLKKEFEN